VALRSCTISFRSPSGIIHSAEVQAETLYEAAALGIALLRKDGWIEGLGPATRLEISVRQPATNHVLTFQQVQRWLDGVTATPADALRKAKLKHLLGAPHRPPSSAGRG
jgi:hypothetical protein